MSRSLTGSPLRLLSYSRAMGGYYRQVFRPGFQLPASWQDMAACSATDFLLLVVGLVNVLLVQFALVVLFVYGKEE